jgi:glycolate oxidase iron-sulfur subunit
MAFPLKSPSRADLAGQCVKCGLCLPHCPTYALAGMEAESPRGRIALMADLAENPGKTCDFKHLDACLGCRRCETACPADVSYEQLLVETRAVHPPDLPWPGKAALWLMAHKSVLNGVLGFYRVVFPILPARWRPLPRPEAATAEPAPSRSRNAIFTGCAADTYEHHARRALQQVLRALGDDAVIPSTQVCCGQAARHAGQAARAATLAAVNQSAFSGFDRILVLASGCRSALQDTAGAAVEDAMVYLAERAEQLHFRSAQGRHVALHVPCTAAFHGSDQATQLLLARIPDLQLSVLPNSGCCGGAGLHQLGDPSRAATLRAPVLAAVPEAAEVLLSANIGCRLHLSGDRPILHPIEFMAHYLE